MEFPTILPECVSNLTQATLQTNFAPSRFLNPPPLPPRAGDAKLWRRHCIGLNIRPCHRGPDEIRRIIEDYSRLSRIIGIIFQRLLKGPLLHDRKRVTFSLTFANEKLLALPGPCISEPKWWSSNRAADLVCSHMPTPTSAWDDSLIELTSFNSRSSSSRWAWFGKQIEKWEKWNHYFPFYPKNIEEHY